MKINPTNLQTRQHSTEAMSPVLSGLQVLLERGSVAELRVIATKRGTLSGYFNNLPALADAASTSSGTAPGVYVTLNPVRPDLLARASNRVNQFAKSTTSDADILRRRWLPVDFDPVRPSGISSSQAEHEAALAHAKDCRQWLRSCGWPAPILADSGNGAHLLFRVDLPNDKPSLELVKDCLLALGMRFNDTDVIIDSTTCNAARIWKIYGTLAAKGDSTVERPHRLAEVLELPEPMEVADRALLAELAAKVPQASKAHHPKKSGLDISSWLSDHEIEVANEGPWNGGHKWILNSCPWNVDHTNKSAFVIQFSNGAIAAGCHHASCEGKDWYSLREIFEPRPSGKDDAGDLEDDAD